MLEVNRYTAIFLRVSKIFRPSSMPFTIDTKSSFSKIISAASFVASLPEIFMEIPISACLIAGKSLTPSPVEATINPSLWQAVTIYNF